jgi:hypothetical protein
VHAGAIPPSGGRVTVRKAPGCDDYSGSTSHGIKTLPGSPRDASFWFVGHGNGACNDDGKTTAGTPPKVAKLACPATLDGVTGPELTCACYMPPDPESTADAVDPSSPPDVRVVKLAVAGRSSLAIGGANQLVLELANKGGNAKGVTAKTRSSIAALHGLAFAFGDIPAGETTTRMVELAIPEDTRGETATILVTFAVGNGNAPAELAQKLPLARATCTKITRAQYDDKRAKLQRSLDAGEITQDEFDRFDAELLRCLE